MQPSSSRFLARLLLFTVVVSSTSCATNALDLTELSEHPIAFRHWSNEDARQRKEKLGDSAAKTPFPMRDGIADFGNLTSLLGDDDLQSVERRYPSRLALLNPRTLEVTFVEEAPLGSRPLSWSADHTRLIFSSERRTGSHQIYELNTATRNVRKLSYDAWGIIAAAHGPENSYVYSKFYQDSGGDVRVALMEYRLGQGERKLAENILVRHVSLSPDGKTVVYAPQVMSEGSRSRHPARIVMLDTAPGSIPRETVPGEHPVYSRDGEWVVFSGRKNGRGKLYRMRASGAGRTSIGIGTRDETYPAVSPDGRFIVYVSDHNGLDRLFVMRFDGTGDRLLYDGGMVEWPVW